MEAIRALQRAGINVVMLTDDNVRTAEAVARAVGISQVVADVLPDQKADAVKRLQATGERVAMAGDGINDAPVLAAADVGVAMGTGTAVGRGKRCRDIGPRGFTRDHAGVGSAAPR